MRQREGEGHGAVVLVVLAVPVVLMVLGTLAQTRKHAYQFHILLPSGCS